MHPSTSLLKFHAGTCQTLLGIACNAMHCVRSTHDQPLASQQPAHARCNGTTSSSMQHQQSLKHSLHHHMCAVPTHACYAQQVIEMQYTVQQVVAAYHGNKQLCTCATLKTSCQCQHASYERSYSMRESEEAEWRSGMTTATCHKPAGQPDTKATAIHSVLC